MDATCGKADLKDCTTSSGGSGWNSLAPGAHAPGSSSVGTPCLAKTPIRAGTAQLPNCPTAQLPNCPTAQLPNLPAFPCNKAPSLPLG